MAPTPAELFASPDHYLHSFERDGALYVAMDRAAYARSIFLDHRISPAAPGAIRVCAASLAVPDAPPPETGWIFHVAHCGSTLLARGLEALGGNLVLREPLALRQLALAPDAARLSVTLAHLARRYDPALATLVKANVPVNFVLAEIAAAQPEARAILLYCGLDDYLLAILRSEQHRAWVRAITALLAAPLGDLSDLSDAECAAVLWAAQIGRFAAAAERLPGARGLDAEAFFARPAEALFAAAAHLGVPGDRAAAEALVAGPLFATYSKNPGVAFANADRVARKRALAVSLGGEIAAARSWLGRAAPAAGDAFAALEAASLLAA